MPWPPPVVTPYSLFVDIVTADEQGMSDELLRAHWRILRLLVPEMVTRAIRAEQESAEALHAIQLHLEPELEVPWVFIPVRPMDLAMSHNGGQPDPALQARLRVLRNRRSS